MATNERETLRCAVYTRKSSEHGLEQDFNSLDAQCEAAEPYIKSQAREGWRLVKGRYDDGGISGGTLERPAPQSLLDDIRTIAQQTADGCCRKPSLLGGSPSILIVMGGRRSLDERGDYNLSSMLLSQIDKPINRSNHDRASDDISHRDRHEITEEKIAPGQAGIVCCGPSNRVPERSRGSTLDEKTHRNEIYVCDAVLESGCGKACDRRHNREDLVDRRARAVAHPGRQTHQRVAHDAKG
jgi:hypothetical protein